MKPDCERALLSFDQELNASDAAWLTVHLSECPDCTREFQLREGLRGRLRRVARGDVQSPALESAVHARVHAPLYTDRRLWAAAAAVVIVAAGAYWALPWTRNHMSESAYFAALPPAVSSVMRVGLSDHVHCAAYRKWPAEPASFSAVARELPPQYQPVAAAVRSRLPAGCQVLLAHQCKAQGRGFIHLAMRTDTGKLISLVMTPRQPGESFGAAGVPPVLDADGHSIFAENAPAYRIAGFETAGFLVYVVSDLPAGENRQLAVRLAKPIEAALRTRG